jgi:hypothetical protein
MQTGMANIAWEFTDKKVTPWGGLRVMKEFLDRIKIKEKMQEIGLPSPGSNRGYNPIDIIESFWVCVWIGGVRFAHTMIVRFDDALREIFNWKRVASVSTYTRFFKRFKINDIDRIFNGINKWFFSQMKEMTMTIDLDSTVITRYGKQEGSLIGYNTNRRGRPSHHPIMAFISDLRMVAHSWLRSGNTGSSNGAINFLNETLDILGKHKVGLLRMDSGFFDGKFFSHIEGKSIDYIGCVRMNSVIKNGIYGINNWIKIDNGIEVGEFMYKAHNWDKERRIVAIRQDIEERPKSCGKYLFDMKTYRYQAWVTSLKLAPQDIWRLYNQRADSENRIEELKYDFGMNGFCLDNFYGTEAAFRCVMISYNIISLFRQAVLGFKTQHRLQTIRFKCFAIGSWIGKKYRKKVLKLSVPMERRAWFEGLFSRIIEFSVPFPVKI